MSQVIGLILCSALVFPTLTAERSLSLDEPLQLARQRNHDLAAARAILAQARTGVDRALGALLPTATASGTYTYNYRNVTFADIFPASSLPSQFSSLFGSLNNISVLKQDALQSSLSVNIPLASPSAWFGLESAKQTVHAADANFSISLTGILFSTAQAYFAAAGSDELLQARRHATEISRATQTTAEARLQAGTAIKTEVMRAQLAVVKAKQNEREAEDAHDMTYRALATILGLREPFNVTPALLPEKSLEQPVSVDSLNARSLVLRPEIAALSAIIHAAEAQRRSAAWQWAPTLNGFGTANLNNYAGFTGDKYAWYVGLSLNWTVYDGGIRDAARHQAEAARMENEERLAQLRNIIRDDITNATRTVETRRYALEAALQSVTLASETLKLFRFQYEAGTGLQLDVIQAQDALVSAEVQLAQARFDLALADLIFRRVVGIFP